MKMIIMLLLTYSSVLFSKNLEINSDHSKIVFDVDYMKLTTVQGQFKNYSGSFKLDGTETQISDIVVSVKASSVDTNEPKRDFHVKGHEFFFVANYPLIEFQAAGPFVIAGDKKIKVKGQLTLRGVKKEIIFDGIYKGKITDPWKKENYFFELTGEMNRQNYGMVWNKELDTGGYLVGDKVRIKINLQAQVQGEKTAFSTHMIPSTKGIVERDQLKKGKIKKLSTSTDPKDHAND